MASDKLEQLIAARNAEVRDKQALLGRYDDVQFSFWAWSQYRDCPQKYIMYTVGEREDVIQDNYWAIKGSVVHTVLEDSVNAIKAGKLDWSDQSDFMREAVLPTYDKFLDENWVNWEGQGVSPALHRRDALPEIYHSVEWMHAELCRQGLLPRDPATIHAERSFKTQLRTADGRLLPVKITGRCDLVFEDPDGIVIVDPKDVTKKSSKSINWRQLVWYALGFEPEFNKPVKWAGFILTYLQDWYKRNPNAVHPQLKQPFREVLFREILEVALKIRQGEFKAKLDRHVCSYCPVNHRCPDYFRWTGSNSEILNTIALLDEGVTEI